MTDGIVSLNSKTHPMEITKMDNTEATFSIKPLNLDSSIVLTITRKQPATSVLTAKMTELGENSEYLYASEISIISDFTKVEKTSASSATFIIAVDNSGSMVGTPLENAKNAAIIFVSGVSVESMINVYVFDDKFKKFKSEPVKATPENKEEACKWISDIKGGGGTEILPVLNDIYSTTKSGAIIFLSDGEVSNTDDVISLVKKNQDMPMFTIGIGSNVSQHLIKEMANQSMGGRSEFVSSSDDKIKDKVLAHLNRAKQCMGPSQKNNVVKINTTGPYKLAPSKIGYLYEGNTTTFYVLSANPIDSVTYEQRSPTNEVLNLSTTYPLMCDTNGYPIHRMAGIKLIHELYASKYVEEQPVGSQIPHLKPTPKPPVNNEDKIKEEVIKVSQTLNILSKYTSFIGVDVESTPTGPIKKPILRQVPLQQTRKESFLQCASIMPMSMGSRNKSLSWGDDEEKCVSKCASMSMKSAPKSRGFSSNRSVGFSESRCDDFSDDEPAPSSEPVADSSSGGFMSSIWNSLPSFGSSTPTTNTTTTKSTHKASYVVKMKLTNYSKLGLHILTSRTNGALPFASEVKVNDLVELTMQDKDNGIYKVVQIGSKDEPWILELVQ
jgi:Mg-chelatase subunit ChlD